MNNAGSNGRGGGICCLEQSAPLISGNVIRDNLANSGGGIYCWQSSPRIIENTITSNISDGAGGIAIGGKGCNPYISRNTISENQAYPGAGGAIQCWDYASPTLTDNTIFDNMAIFHGGGIDCAYWCTPLITGNLISQNTAGSSTDFGGGAICVWGYAFATISDNTIKENFSYADGGGIWVTETGYALISDNSFLSNHSWQSGGGISFSYAHTSPSDVHAGLNQRTGIPGVNMTTWQGDPHIHGRLHTEGAGRRGEDPRTVTNNLLRGNLAYSDGGIHRSNAGTVPVLNNTILNNIATYGGGGGIGGQTGPTVRNNIIRGNTPQQIDVGIVVTYCNVEGGWDGEGNIDVDPLFVQGPEGDYYLSQAAAGQPVDSPCVDAGRPDSELFDGTTRTDGFQDEDVVDMGYHYQLPEEPLSLVTGPGPGESNPPLIRVFPPQQDTPHEHEFAAYGAIQFGVNVSCGNVGGDGKDEILTGAGPGTIYGPHVRGFEVDGTPLPGLSFLAYGTNKYGVNVAAGDLDGDGTDEIITGAGPGAVFGPHVRAWAYDGPSGVTPFPGVNYFAYGTPKWGVNVASGDIDGDGIDEIITGAGPGAVYGPHVRGWNIDDNQTVAAIPGVSYFAYGTLKYGVNVSAGDVDGDGIDEIVTGAGPGAVFGPHVRGWNYDGTSVTSLPGFSFFAWDTVPLMFGVNVSSGTDLNGDGRDELVAGRGPDPTADTSVRVFTYDGIYVNEWISLESFPGLTHGVNVSAGRF